MNKLLLLFGTVLILNQGLCERYVEVIRETITVNSNTSLTGYTRNTVEVNFRKGTIGYIYRTSVFKTGDVSVGQSLMNLVKEIPDARVQIGAAFTEFVLANANGTAVDYYIFTTRTDADNFYSKEGTSACQSYPNRRSGCYSSNQCLNQTIWFGFKNNNISQGLDVYLEVIAIVDDELASEGKSTYSFKITNGSGTKVNFQLSFDGITWQSVSLDDGYMSTYKHTQPSISFKLTTQGKPPVQYKISYDKKYKIEWNQSKLLYDLFQY